MLPLNNLQFKQIHSVADIPNKLYSVYILKYNGKAIVVGHGKKNRAKILFDTNEAVTCSHYKSLYVRLHHLYGVGKFERFIIDFVSKEEASKIEKQLHSELGGNNSFLPPDISNKLFENLSVDSQEYLLLKISLMSSFSGLSDLRKWRKAKVISDKTWKVIEERLQLHHWNLGK